MPANTWFQTPLLQPFKRAVADEELLLRAVDDVPPANAESAMNPPLAYCGPALQ